MAHPEICMTPIRFSCAALVLALSASGAFGAADKVPLAAHRAAYDLSLAHTEGNKGVESARGRIVFEFTGTACEGYAMNFRQVVELSGGDIGTSLLDMRSNTFEDGEGKTMRFTTEQRMPQGPTTVTDGTAERKGDDLDVRLKKPATSRFKSKGEIVFPTEHIRMLIDAAKAGSTTLSVKVFDGSENGKKVYDTFSVIGRRIAGADAIEPELTKAGWQDMARWPVSVSYFAEGQQDGQRPLYAIAFELLENGVSRKLRLDYGNFSLNGALTRLDVMSTPACDK
jgi:hypothetical protein